MLSEHYAIDYYELAQNFYLKKATCIAFKVCISSVHAFPGIWTYDLLYCSSYRNTMQFTNKHLADAFI